MATILYHKRNACLNTKLKLEVISIDTLDLEERITDSHGIHTVTWTSLSVATLTTAPGVGASNWLHRGGAVCVMVAFAESNGLSALKNSPDRLHGAIVGSLSSTLRSMTAGRARLEKDSSQRKWKEDRIVLSYNRAR